MTTSRVPDPDHPISIAPSEARVRVRVAGHLVADTHDALVLHEASYQPVYYIPRADIDMTALSRTTHATHCPYKGDAAYFSAPAGGASAANVAWTYERPYEPVIAIRDHLAFYPDRVDTIEVTPV